MTAITHRFSFSFPASAYTILALLMGFSFSLGLRVVIGSPDVSQSQLAAIVFAICLLGLTLATGTKIIINQKILLYGVLGGLFLCLPAAMIFSKGNIVVSHAGSYWRWAVVTSFVAVAEEAFLRGALYDLLNKRLGQFAAIAVPAILFVILHLPLYGWQSVPLDLAVGLWLGVLRNISGSFAAPATAHVIADLASWWL